ncbi:MAG: hypothetical protein LBR24_04170 [Methanobrevibacter sp.]|jgi:hypothetical protein|nr:hypothetical protein [Methanobrevibacter sp.]
MVNKNETNGDLKEKKTKKSKEDFINELKEKNKVLIEELKDIKLEKQKEISSLKKKIFRLHGEKSQISKDLEITKFKDLDIKLKKVDELKQDLLKANHKNDVIKDHLDKAREKITNLENEKAILITIVNEYENQGFFDFIRNRKPNSYYNFFEKESD